MALMKTGKGLLGKSESRSNFKAGFSLLEILIVIVVVASLATLVLPRFAGQAERAKAAEAISIISTIRRALLPYYDEYNAWPANIADDLNAIGAVLNTQFPAPTYGWTFSMTTSGATCLIMGENPNGTLILDAQTGVWTGTGDYAAGAKYFPYLPQ